MGWAEWRTYGTPYMQTNTMNIIGEMQDPEKLVPRVIKCALNGEEMPIFANKDQNDAGKRNYKHARKKKDKLLVIRNNIDPATHANGDEKPEIFNVVGDREISNLDMALLVAKSTGIKLNYKLVDVQ